MKDKEGPSRESIKRAQEVMDRIERTMEQLQTRFVEGQDQDYSCRYGFKIRLTMRGEHPGINISLDHLDKPTILRLIDSGELADELLLIYELSHLPFAEATTLRLESPKIRVFDSVFIKFSELFNVLDRGQWDKHYDAAFKTAQSFSLESDAMSLFYRRLKGSSRRE